MPDTPPAAPAVKRKTAKSPKAVNRAKRCSDCGRIGPQSACMRGGRRMLPNLPDASINLVVTSPPYANKRKSTYDGIHPDQYSDWFLPIAKELRRVLTPDGSFVLNIEEPVVNGERHTCVIETVLAVQRNGWILAEEFTWHKPKCFPGKWLNRFRDAFERIYQFTASREHYLDENFLQDHPDNVLYGATVCDNRQHSAAFPEWFPEWFIQAFSRPGDVVNDPFLGSGATAKVALENSRHAVGIEMHPPYWESLQCEFRSGQ